MPDAVMDVEQSSNWADGISTTCSTARPSVVARAVVVLLLLGTLVPTLAAELVFVLRADPVDALVLLSVILSSVSITLVATVGS
jgi:hypothetical protein